MSPWDKNTWERREMAEHDKLRRKVRLTVFPFSNILQVIYVKRCNFLGASNRGSARLLLDLAIHRYNIPSHHRQPKFASLESV